MDNKRPLWIKSVFLWIKKVHLWIKSASMAILWIKQPNLWRGEVPASYYLYYHYTYYSTYYELLFYFDKLCTIISPIIHYYFHYSMWSGPSLWEPLHTNDDKSLTCAKQFDIPSYSKNRCATGYAGKLAVCP